MERIDKILSSTGRWTRREARELIRAGRALVNGTVVRDPAAKADAETASITVNGEALEYRRFTWLMLNKPAGYLSATEDGRGPVVLDLLPPELRRRGLFPVGRLDKETEGLLLLSNDGALAHRLLSPKYHVEKVYRARVDGILTEEDRDAFAAGMTLEDGTRCLPAELEIVEPGTALVTLREGKYRQVRRMLAGRGKPVVYLERIRMGNLPLDSTLERGNFRFLTDFETEALRSLPAAPGNGHNFHKKSTPLL